MTSLEEVWWLLEGQEDAFQKDPFAPSPTSSSPPLQGASRPCEQCCKELADLVSSVVRS